MSAAPNDTRTQAIDADAGGVRRRQLLLFSGIAAALLVALALWLGMGSDGQPPAVPSIDAELAGPDSAEEAWTRRSEARIGTIEARLREMETDARRLGAENERLRAKLAVDAADARAVIDRQAAMIDDLERRVSEGLPAPADPGQAAVFPGAPENAAHSPGDGLPRLGSPVPLIETFELDDPSAGAPAIKAWKPLSLWLPAGSHAEAIVLAGVDASAGISSQGDPRPLLLRLTGPAWTAAEDGAAFQVDVAGCTVTGAAHGDLSSEKVYARLRTLTCAGPEPGSVIETEVAGFIAGSGKTGVRGPVVSREGALVPEGVPRRARLGRRPGGRAGVPAAGRRDRRRQRRGREHRARGHRPGRSRSGCGIGGTEGRGLPDPARRAVPAGHPAPRGHARERGVPGGCAPRRRAARRSGQQGRKPMRTMMTQSLNACLVAAAGILLAGCSATHVGESWQCPLAQGTSCTTIAEADPAVPAGAARPAVLFGDPLPGARRQVDGMAAGGRGYQREACDRECGPLAWLRDLFEAGTDNDAASLPPSAPVTAATEPVVGPAAETPSAAPEPVADASLRVPEVVGRIWIAPFVDANGIYREAHWVRVVLEPAGWKRP